MSSPKASLCVLVWLLAFPALLAGEEKPAERAATLRSFYLVKLATSTARPSWSDYILEVKPKDAGVEVREIRIGPLSAFCTQCVTVKAIEKVVAGVTPLRLVKGPDLCRLQEPRVSSEIMKRRMKRAVAITHSARFRLVTKCGDAETVFDLPYPEGVHMPSLRRHAAEVAGLWELFAVVEKSTFGGPPLFDAAGDDQDQAMQQLGASLVPELKSGKFDAGFSGIECRGQAAAPCEANPVASLLADYSGPVEEAQVKLLDREKLPLTKYVAPQYPASARQERMQERVVVELRTDPASGAVVDVIPLSPPGILQDSTVEAARRWQLKAGSPQFVVAVVDFSLHCPEAGGKQ